jgi:hypothetical protein
VYRVLLNLCHRPAIRFGLARDPSSRFRNAPFASFLAESNGHQGSDHHDAILRSRKIVRQVLTLLIGGGLIWIVVESARAISTF